MLRILCSSIKVHMHFNVLSNIRIFNLKCQHFDNLNDVHHSGQYHLLVSRVMHIMRDDVCDAKNSLTSVDVMPIYLTF